MKLSVPGMDCGHCKIMVEKALTSLDPKASVAVDLPARVVDLESSASDQMILAALKAVGYEASIKA